MSRINSIVKKLKFKDGKIIAYKGKDNNIEIPDKIKGKNVTKIGAEAFLGIGLKSVEIPWFTEEIGIRAFQNNHITTVDMSDVVVNICEGAFNNNLISEVKISRNAKSIGDYAFRNNNLTDVLIPNSVERIGNFAFYENPLKRVSIPYDTDLGEKAFPQNTEVVVRSKEEKLYVVRGHGDGTGIIKAYLGENKDIVIPETIDGLTITHIGVHAFSNRALTSVVLPNTINSILDCAFRNNHLINIVIPDSVESIYDYAFERNRLSDITLSKNIKKLGPEVFASNSFIKVFVPVELMSQSIEMKLALMQAFDAGVLLVPENLMQQERW